MKIMSLSLDKSILDMSSLLAKKTREYASLVDEYVVIVPSSEECELNLDNNLKIFGVVATSRPLVLIKMYLKTRDILKSTKIDVITTQDPFEFGVIALLLKWEYKIAWNTQEHGDFFSQKHWKNEAVLNQARFYLGKHLIKKADSIRVVSERTKKHLETKLGIKASKIIKVPVLTEYKEEEMVQRKKQEYFTFLNLGRFVKQKNLPLLIRAFKRVNNQLPNTRLVLIGAGPEKIVVERLIQDLSMSSSIQLKDWVRNVYDNYQSSDAYVLSSNYEGWGRVIVEAVVCRLPIVMTDVGCAGEIITNNKSGLVVPVGDEKELAEAMLKIVRDKDLREKLVEGAYAEVKKLPNKQETLKLYRESWQKAIANNKYI